jgi:dihydroorotate dehydrogenase
VTPRPQAGSPRPRLFRLTGDRALINRFGFNNDGFDTVRARLLRGGVRNGAILGVNLGANRTSPDPIADYEAGVAAFAGIADYATLNISSPNTPGLRTLQEKARLDELLRRIVAARASVMASSGRSLPLLVKISPDLSEAELAEIAGVLRGSGLDGAIIGNTTLSRPQLVDRAGAEPGGLSGRPLFQRSTVLLARFRQLVGRDLRLIGVGGIEDGATAWQKFEAGADLVQLYSGMIFAGPGLAVSILRDLDRRLQREGLGALAGIVGRRTEEWAARSLTPESRRPAPR